MFLRLIPQIFFHDLTPILIAIAAGWFLGKRWNVPPQPLARASFYVLNPSLVYISLSRSDIGGAELARFLGFAATVPLTAGMLTFLLSRALRLSALERTALMLTAMFVNAGSYGLGVVQRAFGEAAMAWAVLFFMTNNLLLNTVGLLLTFHGGGRVGWRQALSLPALYAALAAALVRLTRWHPPEPLEAGVALLSRGAIPLLLMVLGLELSRARLENRRALIGLATALRLAVMPATAVLLARAWGLEGPAWQAGILESAMPAAISGVVMAVEFGVYPHTIAGVILLSTLLSPLTLSLWIAWLRG